MERLTGNPILGSEPWLEIRDIPITPAPTRDLTAEIMALHSALSRIHATIIENHVHVCNEIARNRPLRLIVWDWLRRMFAS